MKLDVAMTSPETKALGGLPPKIQRVNRVEQVIRKPSFKCPVPNRPSTNQRITRKVTLPMSTVQALTCKFNELSQTSQTQIKTGVKTRKGQALVKSKIGVNGKSSTITVVICRKPSSLKQKKQEERKRKVLDEGDAKPSNDVHFNVREMNKSQRNVQQRVTEFEERKSSIRATDADVLKPSVKRTSKVLVPKVIVDIDLSDDQCLNNSEVPKSTRDDVQSQTNGWSVRTAIDRFEKNIGSVKTPLSVIDQNNAGKSKEQRGGDRIVDENENTQSKNENVPGNKQRPIATIKPILKKTEDRSYPVSTLSPKDSLYRKKYIGMKRDQTRGNKENGQELRKPEKSGDDATASKEMEESDSGRYHESLEKLKNTSSLFKQISQSSVRWEPKEKDGLSVDKERQFAKLLRSEEETAEKGGQLGSENLKPNASFLWSRKEEIPAEVPVEKMNRSDMPLPLPPENYIPDISDDRNVFPETIYDDVRPKASEEFDKASNHSDETVYDDIGVYNKCSEGYEKINGVDDGDRLREDTNEHVMKKNFLNNMVNGDMSDSLYCISENLVYNYDDGESERYHYIRRKNSENARDSSESYQYIQNEDEDNNIYEDIQSVRHRLLTQENNKEMYMSENGSVGNCYESVYERYSNTDANQPYIRSNSSDASVNSNRSTYEKSNSLYGMTTGNTANSDQRSNSTEMSETDDPDVYHASPFDTRPSSESSHSNSDEWVEVSDTESEQTIYLVQERPRKTKTGAFGWAQKERRRWLKMQKADTSSDESKNPNSEDHFYESIGHYGSGDDSAEDKENYYQDEQLSQLDDQQIYNEDLCIDDFDSQSSDDEPVVDAKLPETPNNGYNLTKSLKAAGKKLRKNFSLRTSDFSKSLKRFKKQSRPKLSETVFSPDQEVSVNNASQNHASHSGSSISVNLNNSDSSTSSNNLSKGSLTSEAKSFAHRKTWTFRNKFKKGSSSSDIVPEQENQDNRNSVFYLSLNEVRGHRIEKNDEFLNEIQNLISQRNSNSLENVSEGRAKRDSFKRQSQVSEGRVSTGKPRPSIPPPPPPNSAKSEILMDGTRYSDVIVGRKDRGINNSLYVESGLFDKQQKRSRCMTDSSKSWYAEVGLYAANENSSQGKKSQMFVDEPLYQFYTECVNQQARDDIMRNYDSEGYEEINDYYSIINEKRRTLDIKNVRPNFEDFNDDIAPKPVTVRPHNRTLWCQIPVVIDSCVLKTLPDQVKKLQEAKFEILTSEESYMNSLNVLENHFMKRIGESNLITKRDFKILFSNILPVKKCSENFLNDLENCWQNNIMLNGICDIVYKHSIENFNVYVKYCKNQISIYRTLRELIDKNSSFESALKEIESDPICQNLSIHSFLMLPMQRITRLPLLLGAVLARLDKTDDEYEVCKSSFEVLNKIVQECDEEARRMEKCEEMLILSQQLEFPREIRGIPVITGQRFLVKSGQVTQLVNREENKLTFGKKFSKVNLTLFLFTDLLVITKKKSVRNYVVVDHCPRNLVQMQTTEGLTQIPVKLNSSSDSGGKLLMLLTMLENHEKKTVEMVLSFEMESDRQRWLEAVTPKLSENPDESIYEEWDCPQAIALYEFTSTQPDELSLCIGDVVNVLKKMNDGWYQGERLRDGARGWFPQNHTQEILSPHVRAKNKKLRYKILALTGNFIESQMKNGKQ